MTRTAFALLLLVPTIAVADPMPEAKRSFAAALAVNPPIQWKDGQGIAASAYVAVARQHAIRLNVARFPDRLGTVIDWVWGDGDSVFHEGRRRDIGIGWQYFPHGVWNGVSVELGALWRTVDVHEIDDTRETTTQTQGYAGRMLVGWSYLVEKRAFASVAFGLSRGRYTSDEHSEDTFPSSDMTDEHSVAWRTSAELYWRIGVAFGL